MYEEIYKNKRKELRKKLGYKFRQIVGVMMSHVSKESKHVQVPL